MLPFPRLFPFPDHSPLTRSFATRAPSTPTSQPVQADRLPRARRHPLLRPPDQPLALGYQPRRGPARPPPHPRLGARSPRREERGRVRRPPREGVPCRRVRVPRCRGERWRGRRRWVEAPDQLAELRALQGTWENVLSRRLPLFEWALGTDASSPSLPATADLQHQGEPALLLLHFSSQCSDVVKPLPFAPGDRRASLAGGAGTPCTDGCASAPALCGPCRCRNCAVTCVAVGQAR